MEIKYSDWIEKGKSKYGKLENWKFKCPKCGNIASVKEFMNIGENANTAAQNCIGRFVKDKGCDWAAYGLFGTLDKGKIVIDDAGNKTNVFDFDEV